MNKGKLKKGLLCLVVFSSLISAFAGCASSTKAVSTDSGNTTKTVASLQDIENAAKKEGKVISVGMPDDWADWKDTWSDLSSKYGLQHSDTDMHSAEEISKFDAEKNNPTADIGDVGASFGPVAVQKGVTQSYKTSNWDSIPDWAKDKDGNWVEAYQGTIAFITNKKLVKNPPKSWSDIKTGDYKVTVGDVTKASQAQNSILSCSAAFGGNEKNINAGLDFFADLAKKGRLASNEVSVANLEKGEIQVAVLWDFNALSYRDKLNKDDYEISIPQDGTISSGYTTIINKYAPHPNAAKLAREYILSDAGQINLAKGYARPIRSDVKLPAEVQAKLIPADQYKKVIPVKDFDGWTQTAAALPQLWQEKVLINVK